MGQCESVYFKYIRKILCHPLIATHHMVKFIIVFGQKYFSNYVAESDYWIIQTKPLTALFKNNIETKEYRKFDKTQKWFLWLNLKRKIVRIKRYAEKICWSMKLISKEDLG